MEPTVQIRKANPKDLDPIYQFICHLEETRFPFDSFEEIFLENLQDPDKEYLVAVADADEAIGFISCHGQKLLHHAARVYEIQELYVARNWRGKGIGKSLLQALESRLEIMDYQTLEVSANVQRTDAKKFYTKSGFQATHIKMTRQRN